MWWELTSDFELPPLSPAMDLRDNNGNPIARGEVSNGCHRYEGLYIHPELHYRAEDLETMKPCDLAWTAESFGGVPSADARVLIASNRFYRFCVDHALKTEWVPVRIDP
jgi:hypothetical protein